VEAELFFEKHKRVLIHLKTLNNRRSDEAEQKLFPDLFQNSTTEPIKITST